ncbi:MAG: glycosyltransferase family 39 protein [Deltaproteobacteria bacterium]|nr:glycosyltransferase family 39 protein [Deltaproteobacteria bacterium]
MYFSSKKGDLAYLSLLIIWGAAIAFIGLGAFEFFRHTEADRTLIGLEMLSSGNYLVPHLLGSVILTKPPLFYWLIAASIALFGQVSEWVARFPSAVAALILICCQYLFWRRSGHSKNISTLSALMLSSCPLFFQLSSVAEIDMVFALFCAISLYSAYFVLVEASKWSLVISGIAAGLAFLTKGPPIVFFLIASTVLFYIWLRFRGIVTPSTSSLWRFFSCGLVWVCTFLFVAGIWLALVASTVGWEALVHQFRVEVVERVVSANTHSRGLFFYLGSLIGGLSPWSIFLLGGLFVALKSRQEVFKEAASAISSHLLVYSMIVVFSSMLMLSLAQGKSSRYLFPVYPFATNIALYSALALRGSNLEAIGFSLCSLLAWIVGIGLMGAGFYLGIFTNVSGVHGAKVVMAGVCLGSAVFFFAHVCRKRARIFVMVALLLIMICIRMAQVTVYASNRNAERSVKGLAAKIDELVAPGKTIYTVEMFERWIVFYLVKQGRVVRRLSPSLVSTLKNSSEEQYILLNYEEELWRLNQLRYYDKDTEVIATIEDGRERLLLIKARSDILEYLEPHEYFPTIPTLPAANAVWKSQQSGD